MPGSILVYAGSNSRGAIDGECFCYPLQPRAPQFAKRLQQVCMRIFRVNIKNGDHFRDVFPGCTKLCCIGTISFVLTAGMVAVCATYGLTQNFRCRDE